MSELTVQDVRVKLESQIQSENVLIEALDLDMVDLLKSSDPHAVPSAAVIRVRAIERRHQSQRLLSWIESARE